MAKRKSDDSGEKPKKAKLTRRTSDAIEFLAQKLEKKRELKKEDLVTKKKHRAKSLIYLSLGKY